MKIKNDWYKKFYDDEFASITFVKDPDKTAEQIANALKIPRGISQNILDMCCGDGRLSNALAKNFNNVVGIDQSEHYINIAKECKYPKCDFICTDARNYNEFGKKYDVVVCWSSSLANSTNDSDNYAMIQTIASSLNDFGQFIIKTVNPLFVKKHLKRTIVKYKNDEHGKTTIIRTCGIDYNYDMFNSQWDVILPDGTHKEFTGQTKMYTPDEYKVMFELAGLKLDGAYSALDPIQIYSDEYPDLFLIGHKKWSKFKSLTEEIHKVVERVSDNIAVCTDGKDTSYFVLWDRAKHIAAHLTEYASLENIIGLQLDKSAEYVSCVLGCWLAGKAFVPILPDFPDERKDFIIKDVNVKTVITADTYESIISDSSSIGFKPAKLTPETPAYVIYSSGSTGHPKGIMVTHAGLYNLAFDQSKAFRLQYGGRMLFFVSICFDASISDMLNALITRSTLVIDNDIEHRKRTDIMNVIKKHKITHIDMPPSLLNVLNPSDCTGSYLDTIIIGGEAADPEAVRKWADKVRVVNVYGPTEATVCTSLCICGTDWSKPLLGHEIADMKYTIMQDGHPADAGELWISGPGLAAGYINNIQMTSEKFVTVNGVRYYRTGDYVERQPDGEIMYVRRIDRQFKMHGNLIEPEEIERTVMDKVKGVTRCALVKMAYEDKTTLFVSTDKSVTDLNVKDKITTVLQSLPKYMTPSFIQILENFPLTVSDKPDYERMKMIKPFMYAKSSDGYEYSTPTEKTIAETMSAVLNNIPVAPDDDFNELGGGSLESISLIAELKDKNIYVSPEALRNNSTPRALAQSCGDGCTWMNSTELYGEDTGTYTEKEMPHAQDYIMITGATGCLGAHLLAEILSNESYNDKNIICIVRNAADDEAAYDRIKTAADKYNLPTPDKSRIISLPGDLQKPIFGLPRPIYKMLSRSVSAVFHCAATVNMIETYDNLKRPNVETTKNVLRFCMANRKKVLNYASTLSVFVSTDRAVEIAEECDNLKTPCRVFGGYAQTKFECEKILMRVKPEICQINIFRFGLLCGSTQTGTCTGKEFLTQFFRGASEIGSIPADPTNTMMVDISPVDTAAGIMADIAAVAHGGTYHIASEEPLSYNKICRLLNECNDVHITNKDYNTWVSKIPAEKKTDCVRTLILALCRLDKHAFENLRYMDLFQTTGIKFDMKRTHALTDRRCTYTDELIKTYIRNSVE